MQEQVRKVLDRLNLIKDTDPFYQPLLNDSRSLIVDLNNEVRRLEQHNQQLLQMVYQNLGELENLNEPTGK